MMFNALCEIVVDVQNLIKNGWVFEWEYGERKFQSGRLIARKGEKQEMCYESSSIEEFLDKLINQDIREKNPLW